MFKKASLILLVCSSHQAFADEPLSNAFEVYFAAADRVRESINPDSWDSSAAQAAVVEMLDAARPILPAYAGIHSQCSAQLASLIDQLPEVLQWSAATIRTNIEVGEALPPASGCYPARDIIAHPAIVRALLRDGAGQESRVRLSRELAEAVEHAEEIKLELIGE